MGETRERCSRSQPPKGLDQGSGTGLAYLEALLGRGAAYLGLDGVELGDAPQSLGGDRGVVAVEDLAQLSPGVRPAQSQGKGRLGSGRQAMVASVAIDLQDTGEAAQESLGMDAPVSRCVQVNHPRGSGPFQPRSSRASAQRNPVLVRPRPGSSTGARVSSMNSFVECFKCSAT